MRALAIGIAWLLAGAGRAGESAQTPAEIIRWLFANAEALEQISFADLAEAASGKKVFPLNPADATDRAILQHLEKAAQGVIEFMNSPESPAKGLRRINEASKHVEDELVKRLNTGAFSCQFPKNAQGHGQRSGYPDLELIHTPTGKVTYVDPKLYEATARESTLRTFYFEPKQKTLKITKDARHLLLGIAHDGKDGEWTFQCFDVVDVSKLHVRLKAEFDAANKDLYDPALRVGGSKP